MDWFLAAAGGGFWKRASTMLQALYQVVLGLGGPGLLILALLDSSFLSIPEGNDFLIIILSTGQGWEKMAYYAAMTTVGSVTGCSLLYWVGTRGGRHVERRLHRPRVQRIQRLYQKRGALAVIIPSLLPPPTPFKMFVLCAGAFRLPFPKFLASVAIGRSLRYFTWGVLAVLYGEKASYLLQEHFQRVGIFIAIAIALTLVWFLILKPLLWRKDTRE